MAYMLKPLKPGDPETVLLDVLKARTGAQDLTDAWLDPAMIELMAYLIAGPAKCKRDVWLSWEDLPVLVQGILLGALARHASQSSTNVVMETIGDYSVKYSDPALFEGRIPRFLNDGEELAIGRLAGCGGTLRSVRLDGNPIIDHSEPETDNWNRMNEALNGRPL